MEKPYRQNAAVIITDGQGRVLLCERVITSSIHGARLYLQTVQGGIDAGETPREAAIREVQEELGITPEQFSIEQELPGKFRYDFTDDLILKPSFQQYCGQEQTFFLAKLVPGTVFALDTHGAPEFERVFWGTGAELLAGAWGGKRPGMEMALKTFGLLS